MRVAYGGFLALFLAALLMPGPSYWRGFGPSYWRGFGASAAYAQPATPAMSAMPGTSAAPAAGHAMQSGHAMDPAHAGHDSTWTPVAASNIVAVQTKWGVVTSAEVQLKMCYEARIVARTKMKFDYVVQDERQPGAGDMCGMAIRPATVAIAEAGKTSHVHVAAGDAEAVTIVPLAANAVVRF
jgi:hypothetical protein